MTVESIMKKAGFESLDVYLQQEEEIEKEYEGYEIERVSPFKMLTTEELTFLVDYLFKNPKYSEKKK